MKTSTDSDNAQHYMYKESQNKEKCILKLMFTFLSVYLTQNHSST